MTYSTFKFPGLRVRTLGLEPHTPSTIEEAAIMNATLFKVEGRTVQPHTQHSAPLVTNPGSVKGGQEPRSDDLKTPFPPKCMAELVTTCTPRCVSKPVKPPAISSHKRKRSPGEDQYVWPAKCRPPYCLYNETKRRSQASGACQNGSFTALHPKHNLQTENTFPESPRVSDANGEAEVEETLIPSKLSAGKIDRSGEVVEESDLAFRDKRACFDSAQNTLILSERAETATNASVSLASPPVPVKSRSAGLTNDCVLTWFDFFSASLPSDTFLTLSSFPSVSHDCTPQFNSSPILARQQHSSPPFPHPETCSLLRPVSLCPFLQPFTKQTISRVRLAAFARSIIRKIESVIKVGCIRYNYKDGFFAAKMCWNHQNALETLFDPLWSKRLSEEDWELFHNVKRNVDALERFLKRGTYPRFDSPAGTLRTVLNRFLGKDGYIIDLMDLFGSNYDHDEVDKDLDRGMAPSDEPLGRLYLDLRYLRVMGFSNRYVVLEKLNPEGTGQRQLMFGGILTDGRAEKCEDDALTRTIL